jgi:hypothetical protein
MIFSVTVEVLRRPWAKRQQLVEEAAGYLYDVHLAARDSRVFDYEKFLEGTTNFHSRLVHLCLSRPAHSVRLIIPALLGAAQNISLIEHAIEVSGYVVDRAGRWKSADHSAQAIADQWPEFVLGPDSPLTILTPDMQCTFFAA